MSQLESDGSSIPSTPESFSQDVTSVAQHNVFASLRPLNPPGWEAYDAAINTIIKHPEKLKHMRKFLSADKSRMTRADSIFSEDEDDTAEQPFDPLEKPSWTGSFKFCLETLPHNPTDGWYLGTNRGRAPGDEVDILLAPPTDEWRKVKIAGKHARLFIHPESCRIVLEAHHIVVIGRNGAKILAPSHTQVLEQGELISIGSALYIFKYADFFATLPFEAELRQYMQKYHNPQWSMNKIVMPSSVGVPASIGEYFCSSGAFERASSGNMHAGWNKSGSVVAIKEFKDPTKTQVRNHVQLMQRVGKHNNILQLVHCFGHLDKKFPDAYCVYTPLPRATLAGMATACQLDFDAKIAILTDCLSGLSYLHDQKHIMHRNISPSSIAIVSFDNPKAVITDLDLATSDQTSTDYQKIILPLMAPEMACFVERNSNEQRLKEPQPPPYGKMVDIWTLGLSMLACFYGVIFSWDPFYPRDQKPPKISLVTKELQTEFHRRLRQLDREPAAAETAASAGWILAMTEYKPVDRPSAWDILVRVRLLAGTKGRGRIVLKSECC